MQREGEAFEEYLSRLKLLVKPCAYEALEDELLRDQFIVGIMNDAVRKVLLEKNEVDINETIRVCRLRELTENQLSEMTASSKFAYEIHNRKPELKYAEKRRGLVKLCYFCNREHEMKKSFVQRTVKLVSGAEN